MKTWLKVLLVTLVVAIPAMITGPILWPPPADLGVAPTAGQIPFFIFLAVFEAITLGLGVAFLLFGFAPLGRALGESGWRTWAAYLSIGWFLVSWWPHNNLHTHNGMDLQGLLYIEYGSHLTLMVAGLVLAYSLMTLLRPGDAGARPGVRSGGAATAARVSVGPR